MANERQENKSEEQLREANKKQAALDAANSTGTEPPIVAPESNPTSDFEDVGEEKKTKDANPATPKKIKTEPTDFDKIEGIDPTIKNLIGLAQACAEIRKHLYKHLEHTTQPIRDAINARKEAMKESFNQGLDSLDDKINELDRNASAYVEDRFQKLENWWEKTFEKKTSDELKDDEIIDELIQREEIEESEIEESEIEESEIEESEIEESEIEESEPPKGSPADAVKRFKEDPVAELYDKAAEQKNNTNKTPSLDQEPVNTNTTSPQQHNKT